jgi:hypothetical protein
LPQWNTLARSKTTPPERGDCANTEEKIKINTADNAVLSCETVFINAFLVRLIAFFIEMIG